MITLHMGSKVKVIVVSVGVVELFFPSVKTLVLYDSLFFPSIRRNLISVFALFKQRYSILFNGNISFKLNGYFTCSGQLVYCLYLITPKMYEIHNTELNKS